MPEITQITNNNIPENPKEDDVKKEFPLKEKCPFCKKKVFVVIVLFVLALIGFFTYLFIFRGRNLNILSPFGSEKVETGGDEIVVNYLTGEEVKKNEGGKWVDQRPLGVMINNYIDARPQANLHKADIVYEVVAEGGITRFLAFYLSEAPQKVGPVRSARDYYFVIVKELSDAMIMHWGYSPQAKAAIDAWPVRSLFRGGAGDESLCPECTWRENPRNVASEHTLYASVEKLRQRGFELGWEGKGEFTSWKFKEDKDLYPEASSAPDLTIDFWYEGDYTAIFKYNDSNNSYLRFTGYDADGNPVSHVDDDSGEQLEYKNIIVQFAEEAPIEGDDKNRLAYELVSSGDALIFLDGKVIDATWSKTSRDERTLFYDTSENEIQFNKGKIWISIVPARNVDQVVY